MGKRLEGRVHPILPHVLLFLSPFSDNLPPSPLLPPPLTCQSSLSLPTPSLTILTPLGFPGPRKKEGWCGAWFPSQLCPFHEHHAFVLSFAIHKVKVSTLAQQCSKVETKFIVRKSESHGIQNIKGNISTFVRAGGNNFYLSQDSMKNDKAHTWPVLQ